MKTRFAVATALGLVVFAGCGPAGSEPSAEPRAVVPANQVDFGKVILGTQVTHTYTIRNAGTAPLVLGEPQAASSTMRYEIRCELSARTIAPGESATAKLTIRPLEVSPKLYAGVRIATQDGGEFQIGGRLVVQEPVVLERTTDGISESQPIWTLSTGDVGELRPAGGVLYSAGVDRFRVLSTSSDNPAIRVDAAPLPPGKLVAFKARCGYSIGVRVVDFHDVGRLVGRVTIKTDVKHAETKSFEVHGVRWGPVRIFRAEGARWSDKTARVDLGRFPAEKGKSAALLLAMKIPRGLSPRFPRVSTSVATLRAEVEIDRQRSTPTHVWFKVKLRVPAGKSPLSVSRSKPALLTIETNHPEAKTIRLPVEFDSY